MPFLPTIVFRIIYDAILDNYVDETQLIKKANESEAEQIREKVEKMEQELCKYARIL